jgi:hypothetical protein
MDLFREFKLDQSIFSEKHFLILLDKVKKDGEFVNPNKKEGDPHEFCLDSLKRTDKNYQYIALKDRMKQLVGVF